MKSYDIHHFYERVRVRAKTEVEALLLAQEDYDRGTHRVMDWKDSEHDDNMWEICENTN